MRKIALMHIVLIYVLLSVGVAKSTHYCMGRVQNMALFSTLAEGCFAADERKMPCCEDTLEYLSLDDEHQSETFKTSIQNSAVLFLPEYFELEFQSLINVSDETSSSDLPDPPELSSEPIYITAHQFTFYG